MLEYKTVFSRRSEHGVPENELGIARSREVMEGANQVSHASKTHFINKVQSTYHVFEGWRPDAMQNRGTETGCKFGTFRLAGFYFFCL